MQVWQALFAGLKSTTPYSSEKNSPNKPAEVHSTVIGAKSCLIDRLGYNPRPKGIENLRMPASASHGRGLQLIAAFKLLKGFALLALGIGALKLLHRDVAALVEHWINVFQVDSQNYFIHKLLEKLAVLDDRRLKQLSVGTFIYAAIFFTEGIGLALRKRWAEYFTIIVTSSLLPLEVYVLAKHPRVGEVFALLINLAVVAYLVRELRRTKDPQ